MGVVAVGGAAACTSDVGPASPIDAGYTSPDAASLDAASLPDVWAPDASLPDASLPVDSGAVVDAASSDAGLADALPPLDVFVPILPPTTAAMTGPGLDTCGSTPGSCAATVRLPGGTYDVRIDPATPATVSSYRLDTYKVTVGRFRKFTEAWLGGWRPAEGAGKHLHTNGGRGLARVEGGFESGWQSAWNGWVGAPSQAPQPLTSLDAGTWSANLACRSATGPAAATWSAVAGTRESWPMNCATWVEAQAFCIWDGGFLPSEIEWDFAAIGGSEGRTFPWGTDPVSPARALYAAQQLEPVGSRPAGVGRWGHAEMLGTLGEFVMDSRVTSYASRCVDCAHESTTRDRTTRGTNFRSSAVTVTAVSSVGRSGMELDIRSDAYGFRCARP
jgi:formylglycine-generating enzyme required for sulfatase activity